MPTVSLSNQEFLDAIVFWKPKVAADMQLMSAAFFAIYVEFDKFLNTALLHYATAGLANNGYAPTMRLTFKDEKHFKNILSGDNKNLEINVLDLFFRSRTIWNDIFEDKKNPFEAIFSIANFVETLRFIHCLRNYIAHKSKESKERYETICLSKNKQNASKFTFIEPYDYLNQPYSKANTKKCYAVFIQTMQDICELILNPIP